MEEEEEKSLKLDMKISSQEFPEDSNFMDEGESFRNRDFPDAYSTPPPPDIIPEENGKSLIWINILATIWNNLPVATYL